MENEFDPKEEINNVELQIIDDKLLILDNLITIFDVYNKNKILIFIPKQTRKFVSYSIKLKSLLKGYNSCLIINIDNIGSKQIGEMRKEFRGRGRFLFGKNITIRQIIRNYVKETGNKNILKLINVIKGNCGFVFCQKESIKLLRKDIISKKAKCFPKIGQIAPNDIFIPNGPTGLEPTQTAGFSILNIPTRIYRGQISITETIKVIEKNKKIKENQVSMLKKLNIKPFCYCIKVLYVYEDGHLYDAQILDITNEDIEKSFYNALYKISSLCFTINYPLIINVPHSLINAYKKVLGLGIELSTYSWNGLDQILGTN